MRTFQEVKQAIVGEFAVIDKYLRIRVYGDVQKHLQTCIESDGHHLSDVILKK